MGLVLFMFSSLLCPFSLKGFFMQMQKNNIITSLAKNLNKYSDRTGIKRIIRILEAAEHITDFEK